MFYDNPELRRQGGVKPSEKAVAAIVSLTPAESKRLIAKGVASLPEVKTVLKRGMLVIGWGTTNAYVAEEVLGASIAHKSDFASGVICQGELNANAWETKMMPYVLRDGQLVETHQSAALRAFKAGDVFIKGANAVDPEGNVGVLAAAETGGTIGFAWFALVARGAEFICPVGLEKLVPSVLEAYQKCGLYRFKYSTGVPVSMVPFTNAKVVSEIQALGWLTGVSATHVASGGIGGSEGSVVLSLEGKEEDIEHALEHIKSIKGEPPVPPPRKFEVPPAASLNYDAAALSEKAQYYFRKPVAETMY